MFHEYSWNIFLLSLHIFTEKRILYKILKNKILHFQI